MECAGTLRLFFQIDLVVAIIHISICKCCIGIRRLHRLCNSLAASCALAAEPLQTRHRCILDVIGHAHCIFGGLHYYRNSQVLHTDSGQRPEKPCAYGGMQGQLAKDHKEFSSAWPKFQSDSESVPLRCAKDSTNSGCHLKSHEGPSQVRYKRFSWGRYFKVFATLSRAAAPCIVTSKALTFDSESPTCSRNPSMTCQKGNAPKHQSFQTCETC